MAFGLSKGEAEIPKRGFVASFEPGAEFEGKLKFTSGAARINSHFRGEVNGDGYLLVAERGELEGDVNVKSVTVTGKVKGTIRASERIEIKDPGVILGDIYTPVLVVEPGGYLDGQCHMPAQQGESLKPSAADQP